MERAGAATLTAEERDIPLLQTPDSAQKKLLRTLQDTVAAEATRMGLAEGILASRRTLEALLDSDGWPTALDGWRRPILGTGVGSTSWQRGLDCRCQCLARQGMNPRSAQPLTRPPATLSPWERGYKRAPLLAASPWFGMPGWFCLLCLRELCMASFAFFSVALRCATVIIWQFVCGTCEPRLSSRSQTMRLSAAAWVVIVLMASWSLNTATRSASLS